MTAAPFVVLRRRRISGSGGGADAFSIGGASPELVAAFTVASDGTTAGEYFRKAGSETTFDDLFTFSRSERATQFDSSGNLVWAPHNIAPYSESPADWNTTGTWTGGQTGLNGDTAVSADNGRAIIGVTDDAVAGAKYTCQIVAKAGTATTVALQVYGRSGAYEIAQFTLSGAGSIPAEDADFDDVRITLLSDGWYLLEIDYTATAAHTIQNILARCDGSSSDSGTAYFDSPRLFRSDLGGMADVPGQTVTGFTKYLSTGTGSTSVYSPRRNAHYYNSAWVNGGLQLEAAAATNLILNSRDATTTGWSSTLTATRDQTGIDGVANTATLLANTSPTSGYTQQVVTTAAAANNICMWGFVKKTVGAAVFPTVVLSYGGTARWAHIDTNNGTIHQRTSTTLPDSYGVENYGDWWLVWFTNVNVTSGTTSYIRYYAGGTSDLAAFSGTLTNSITIDHQEINDGKSLPSSPIITTGSTVTRAAETLSIAGADTPFGALEYSFSTKMLVSRTNNPAMFDMDPDGNPAYWHRLYLHESPTNVYVRSYAGSGKDYSPAVQGGHVAEGINIPASIAMRMKANHETQLALGGVSGTAVVTASIGSVAGQVLNIPGVVVPDGGMFLTEFRAWSVDIGEAGIEEVTT
jgi:hypothetical protein